MEDDERRRMAVKRIRKLRKMRLHDFPVESSSDYENLSGRMDHRVQRLKKTLIEDVLPDNETDS